MPAGMPAMADEFLGLPAGGALGRDLIASARFCPFLPVPVGKNCERALPGSPRAPVCARWQI